jgi:hypothetical protein
VAQLRVGLDPGQRVDAVENRHHDVEQDEVEGLAGEPGEGGGAVAGRDEVGIALALKALGQRVEVVLVVVDHEDARARGHAGLSGASSARILPSRRGRSTGLVS